jgi:hypothetical protein
VRFHQIDNTQNTDRARSIAVFVFLAELWLAYWMPIPRLAILASEPVAETYDPLVWVTPELLNSNAAETDLTTSGESTDSITDVNAPPADNPVKDAPVADAEPGENVGSDDIRIVSFSPSVPQWVGDTARFSVTVEYSLATAASGRVVLSICSCKNQEYTPVPLRLSQAEELALFSTVTDATVKKGRSSVTLTRTFRIPVADELLMVARLEGGSRSSPADHRHLKLNDAGRPPQGDKSTVRIQAIDPDPERVLTAKDNVEFWISVDYNLVHEFGVLRVWIADGDAKTISEYRENIRSGQRRLAFTGKVQIPSPAESSSTLTVNAQVQETEPGEVSSEGKTRHELVPVRSTAIDSRNFRVKP